MGKDSKHGLMVQDMKGSTSKEKNTELESLRGLMAVLTMENSLKTISKAEDNIIGLMVENMMVYG